MGQSSSEVVLSDPNLPPLPLALPAAALRAAPRCVSVLQLHRFCERALGLR